MGKAVHAFSYLYHDSVFVKEMFNVVVIDEFLWENPSWQPHVLEFVHVRRQIEILDVDGHELGSWGGNDTVEKDFGVVMSALGVNVSPCSGFGRHRP